jgi:hypothetical protein
MDMVALARVVKSRFGDANGVLITDTDIVDWTNEAVREVIRKTNLSNVRDVALVSVIGTPTSLAMAATDTAVLSVYNQTNDIFLAPTSLEDIMNKGSFDENGDAVLYYISELSTGRVLYLYPQLPTAVKNYSVRLSCFPADVTIAGALPLQTAYHNDLVNFCLARAHEKNQNYQAYREIMDEFNSHLGDRNSEAQRPEQQSYPIIRDDIFDSEGF